MTMMKVVSLLVKRIVPTELPKHLGRWRIESCNTQMNRKIDLSNEDHCGPCGQYAFDKINTAAVDRTTPPCVPSSPPIC